MKFLVKAFFALALLNAVIWFIYGLLTVDVATKNNTNVSVPTSASSTVPASSASSSVSSPSTPTVQPGQPAPSPQYVVKFTPHSVSLKMDQSVLVGISTQDNSSIRFVDIKEDSRCPQDVQCIWAGTVSANMTVTTINTTIKGSTKTTSNIVVGVGDTIVIGNYTAKIESITPYPKAGIRTLQSAYRVNMY